MTDSDKLAKTINNYQSTKDNFAKTAAGKYFSFFRNLVWFCYFLPLLIGAGLLILQPTCGIMKNPIIVTGCQLVNLDMNGVIAFYAHTHIWGVIGVGFCLLVIKAFFIIKFINVEVKSD